MLLGKCQPAPLGRHFGPAGSPCRLDVPRGNCPAGGCNGDESYREHFQSHGKVPSRLPRETSTAALSRGMQALTLYPSGGPRLAVK